MSTSVGQAPRPPARRVRHQARDALAVMAFTAAASAAALFLLLALMTIAER